MLKAKPSVFARVSQDTRHVRDSLPQGAEFIGTLNSSAGVKAPSSMPRPIRVLLIAPSLDIIGGQSIQANLLLRRLATDPSVQVRFLPVNPRLPRGLRIKYVRTLIRSVVYLARLAASIGRADVLHIFTPGYLAFYLAPAPALLLARLCGKRSVLNYHDGRVTDHLARWPLALWWMRLATAIVVPSDFLAAVFTRFGLRAIRIYNITESDSLPYRRRLRPRPVFLHTRALASEYNPACTLRAFSLIQGRYPGASLTMAHDGPQRGELETLAATLGLRHVRFIGSVSPELVADLYDSAEVYLMSPDADNMPLSVLECFAAGLPVVASNAGGIPNIVDHQRTGLLFPPGDHEAMANCALRLLEEPGLATQLSVNARAECVKYAWPQIRPQWLALYRHLLD
jgi:glycosyltransferase involved in cell wall biosynthesis